MVKVTGIFANVVNSWADRETGFCKPKIRAISLLLFQNSSKVSLGAVVMRNWSPLPFLCHSPQVGS